jgi:NADH:ubiquinone oxidoreductase subunit F (NADH-binding)
MTTATAPALPRLLLGIRAEPLTSLDAYTQAYGPLPDLRSLAPTAVIELAERSGLRGHGGASFPLARKLHAVASRRGSKIVVANGSEGEPASETDRALMRQVPHLILDGAAIAARAVGAEEAIIAFSEHDDEAFASLDAAVRARTSGRRRGPEPRFQLAGVPDHFVTGQETALVNLLNGGEARPTFGPRPFERGVRRAPTLVQNVETLSHLALIARHGADWFRRLGPAEDPARR